MELKRYGRFDPRRSIVGNQVTLEKHNRRERAGSRDRRPANRETVAPAFTVLRRHSEIGERRLISDPCFRDGDRSAVRHDELRDSRIDRESGG